MGSLRSNQNPWAPNPDSSPRDCTQGVCTIYCPQFCYLIFPPPPQSDNDSGTPFSPLIIAIIGVLISASLLVGYYTLVTRFCRERSTNPNEQTPPELGRDRWVNPEVPGSGLDETFIKRITVCKYQRGDGLIEGTDCAVCLSEFEENESLRLLPNCSHAFHLPCIDTWLKSQSNCPLCRANVVVLVHQNGPVSHPPPVLAAPQGLSTVNVNPYEFHRSDDLVLVVDRDPGLQQCLVTTLVQEPDDCNYHEAGRRDGNVMSGSVTLQIDESGQFPRGVGSSEGLSVAARSSSKVMDKGNDSCSLPV